jgi:hypothetical protein
MNVAREKSDVLWTREHLVNIVEPALRSPSGDNCQPWIFEVVGRSLVIHHDEEKGRHAINRQNHASLLALGTLVESIAIAASTQGLTLYADFPLDDQRGWVHLQIANVNSSPDGLFDALPNRFTDRRRFLPGPLRAEVRRALTEEARHFPSLGLHIGENISPAFVDYLARCEGVVWRDARYHADLFRWIRFPAAQSPSADGMPWETLGVRRWEVGLLKACRHFSVQRVMNRLGFLRNARQIFRGQLRSSSAVYAITVKSTDRRELVAAGRLAMRLWLRLTQLKHGVQPITLGSLSVYDEAVGALPVETPDAFRALFREGRAVWASQFRLSADEMPVWAFRTGLTRGPVGRTPRRTLGEVFRKS